MNADFDRAIRNITKFGDTDIFPFPVENQVFYDRKEEIISLLQVIFDDFDASLIRYAPINSNSLVPVTYTGFRWATQVDPIWNAFLLALVLNVAEYIEKARIPIKDERVFSYRYAWNNETAEIFDRDYNYKTFMECSIAQAYLCEYVVTCDISEFYARVNHHRLENALKHVRAPGAQPKMIVDLVSSFSDPYSFGMPVGGPSARILSELLLNQIDRLLVSADVNFCRFADDFHIFCNSRQEAYTQLVYLSQILLENQGLQLQKSKTRIMTASEFLSTNPLSQKENQADEQARSLMQFSVRFDPYGADASEKYEALRNELRKFDLIGILSREIAKSRIHIALARKVVSAIRYMDEDLKDGAVISLIQNAEMLYPVFANVLITIREIFSELRQSTKDLIITTIQQMIQEGSHVLSSDVNMSYAIRVLAQANSEISEELLPRIYNSSRSLLIRKDIILAMSKMQDGWYWLSHIRNSFRSMSVIERRAFIIASYKLRDEGVHWRKNIKQELSPLELIVKSWAASKVQSSPDWSVSL